MSHRYPLRHTPQRAFRIKVVGSGLPDVSVESFSPYESVRAVRTLVALAHQCREERVDLFFQGALLPLDVTLRGSGIVDGSVLSVVLEPSPNITINVYTLTGKRIECELPATATVADLKEKIAQLEHIPADQQRLIHWGRQMGDVDTLASHVVAHGSAVHLVMAMNGD